MGLFRGPPLGESGKPNSPVAANPTQPKHTVKGGGREGTCPCWCRQPGTKGGLARAYVVKVRRPPSPLTKQTTAHQCAGREVHGSSGGKPAVRQSPR